MENGTKLEMRHAFDRDIVLRKGYKGFSPRPPGLWICQLCGEGFETRAYHAKHCPDCRPIALRIAKRRWWNKKGAGSDLRRSSREEQKASKTGDLAFTTPNPWKNLMLAIVKNARDENDQEYLNEFGQLYRDAILGGIGWQKNEEGTYIKR